MGKGTVWIVGLGGEHGVGGRGQARGGSGNGSGVVARNTCVVRSLYFLKKALQAARDHEAAELRQHTGLVGVTRAKRGYCDTMPARRLSGCDKARGEHVSDPCQHTGLVGVTRCDVQGTQRTFLNG